MQHLARFVGSLVDGRLLLGDCVALASICREKIGSSSVNEFIVKILKLLTSPMLRA